MNDTSHHDVRVTGRGQYPNVAKVTTVVNRGGGTDGTNAVYRLPGDRSVDGVGVVPVGSRENRQAVSGSEASTPHDVRGG